MSKKKWFLGIMLSLLTGMFLAAGEVNLADDKYKVIFDASDAIDAYDFQSSAAFDGKTDTAWVTGNDMTGHSLTACWFNQVVNISQLSIDFKPVDFKYYTHGQLFNGTKPELRTGRTRVPAEVKIEAMINNKYLEIASLKLAGTETALNYKLPEMLRNVQQVKVSMNSAAGENFAVREIKIIGEEPVGCRNIKPQFSTQGGAWIWGDTVPEIPSKSTTKWYFRRVFESEKGLVAGAVLTFAAYNRGEIYLNGKEVCRVSESGFSALAQTVRVELPASSINEGSNLIAFYGEKVNQAVGIQGVIFQLAVKYKNGRIQYVGSDRQCAYSSKDEPGWNSALTGFAAWKAARITASGNNYGDTVYGIDYSLPFFSDQVTVTNIELTPAIPKAGDKYSLKVTFDAKCPLTANYGVIAEFGELPVDYPHVINLLLGENYLLPENGLKKGSQGVQTLTMTGYWPHGTSSRVPMRLTVSNGKQQAEIQASGNIGAVSTLPAPGKLNCYLGAEEVKFADSDFPRVSTQAGRLLIDGKATAPMMYSTNTLTAGRFADFLRGDNLKIFRIQPAVATRIMSSDSNMEFYNKNFLESLRKTIMTACRMDANAKFFIVLTVDFDNEWNLLHPDSQILLGDGTTGIHLKYMSSPLTYVRETVASAVVREKLYKNMKTFVSELRKQPYANSVLGIVLFHGRGGENNWGIDINTTRNKNGEYEIRDRKTMLIGEYSHDSRLELEKYLRATYANDRNWAEAWKISEPDAKIADVVDTNKWPIERFQKEMVWRDRPAGRFMFRDSIKEGKLAEDCFKEINIQRAKFYLAGAQAIKDASDRRLLVGGFIGYTLPTSTNSPPGIAQHSGHQMTSMIRESKDFDFICSPHFYHMRRMGDPIMAMGSADSMRLYDKFFVNEFDSRTYLSAIHPKTFSQWETIHQLRKEFGYALIRNQAYWLLEFPFALSGKSGNAWFADPMIIKDQKRAREIYQQHIDQHPVEKASAEVAVFLSEQVLFYMDVHAPGSTVHSNLINVLLPKFTMTGTPFDIYALEDLNRLVKEGVYKKYKMMIFLNAFHLDATQRKDINDYLKKDKRTLLFFYAPGFLGSGLDKNSSLSLAGIEEVTGLKGMDKLQQASIIGMEPTSALPKNIPALDAKGWWEGHQTKLFKNEIGPVFFLKNDPHAKWQTLANLRIDGKVNLDKVALAKQTTADCTVIYSAIPDLPIDLVTKLVKDAGAHCYVEPGTVVYANKYYVCVNNGFEPRNIKITLPQAADWVEVFDGKTYAVNQASITIPFAKGETKLFKLEYK